MHIRYMQEIRKLTLVWPKQGHVCVSRPGNDDNDADADSHADTDDADADGAMMMMMLMMLTLMLMLFGAYLAALSEA